MKCYIISAPFGCSFALDVLLDFLVSDFALESASQCFPGPSFDGAAYLVLVDMADILYVFSCSLTLLSGSAIFSFSRFFC